MEESGAHPVFILPVGRASGMGSIKTVGDVYQFAVDVSGFSPEDIIITTSKNQIEVRAEKLAADGSVANAFAHKWQLPEDADAASAASSLAPDGALTVTARRRRPPAGPPQQGPPTFRSEIRL